MHKTQKTSTSDNPPPPARPKCGEIWMCKLQSSEGSIQSGYRPVFVLSNDKNNTYSPTLNVIPITSKVSKKRKLPVHVELWSYRNYGLSVPSMMLVEQITTVSMDLLTQCIGRISDAETLFSISSAMAIQFPVLQVKACI